MIPHLLQIIGQAYSGGAARRATAHIASYHRIQASPGYRAAAQWLYQQLSAAGLEAQIETYPADLNTRFWTLSSFQAWSCREATLDWLQPDGPQRLCDYRASALSVIQRSVAAAGDYEVVDVGAGRPQDYAGLDVAGKLVLSTAPVMESYRLAVAQRGAAGVLFDDIGATAPGRSRTDLPDARQYASFWWGEPDPQGWGFVLTPRQGDAIRAALASGQQVLLRVHIDARLYDDVFENVVAIIPGSGPEAVLATAHLCHPQDFANDNASGAAALLETAQTLARLIAAGELPQPRRSLIFLWIPEMTGTYAWLSRHEAMIPNIVAGINLDMVGEDQSKTGSVLALQRPPAALPDFTADLLSWLRDDLVRAHFSMAEGGNHLPLIRTTTISFTGGSDHMITADPTVGIPTPMLNQWPDRVYHTTADTMDMVDARSLWLAGALAGAYLMWLGLAEAEDVMTLGWEMLFRYEADLAQWVGRQLAVVATAAPAEQARAWARLDAGVSFREERMSAALMALSRLAPVAQRLPQLVASLESITQGVLDRARQHLRPHTFLRQAAAEDDWGQQARQLVPRRLYRGPIMEMGSPQRLYPYDEADLESWRRLQHDVPNWRLVRALAEYWTDGERSLAEIARLVALESGQDAGPAIETWFRLLAKAGLMTLDEPAGE